MSVISFDYTDEENQKFLKKYGLDSKSVLEYRLDIARVEKEVADELGDRLNWEINNSVNPLDDIIPLIKAGADVNKLDKDLDTPLVKCIKFSCLSAAIELLKAGALVNLACFQKNTPLLASAYFSPFFSRPIEVPLYDFVRILLIKGADVNAKNFKGETALMIARKRNKNLCDLLMAAGATEFVPKIENNSKKLDKITTADDVNVLIDDAISKLEKIKSFTIKK